MKFRKVSALLLAGAMCAATVVGCGKTSSTSGTGSNDATKAAEDEEITATITVWGPAEDQSVDNGEWLQNMCKKFNDEHPKWNLTFKFGTCSEGDAGKTVSADPSASADVYMFANDQLQTLIDAGAISKLGGSALETVKKNNSEAMLSTVTIGDDVYGVPFTGNTWFLYYNKDIFTADDVKNLDTMLSKGKVSFKLTDSWYIGGFYIGNGCTVFGADGKDEKAGVDLTGDKATDVTKYLVDLAANPNFVNDADQSGITGFNDGTIGAFFSGTWDKSNIKLDKSKVGVVAAPTYTLNGKENQMTAFAGSKSIGVNPNCKYPQVAVALALYLGSDEAQISHYEARGIIPCNTGAVSNDKIAADEMAVAQNDTMNNKSVMQPTCKAMSNWWTPAENMGKSIISGETTKDNAADKTAEFNEGANNGVVK